MPPKKEDLLKGQELFETGTVPSWIEKTFDESLKSYQVVHPDFKPEINPREAYCGLMYMEFQLVALRLSKRASRASKQLDDLFSNCDWGNDSIMHYANELDFVKVMFKDFYDALTVEDFGAVA